MIQANASRTMQRPAQDTHVPAAPPPGAARTAPAASAGAGPDPVTAMIHLRRLRYYRNLLMEAFESTVWPDRPAGTLRQERLALGIDRPELDAVALWSVRCGDGTVAIPFIEYILARAREAASAFGTVDRYDELASCLGRLDRALRAITPSGGPAPSLPRLEDVYVPEQEITRLCGFGGILDQILDCCETMSLAMTRDTAAAAS